MQDFSVAVCRHTTLKVGPSRFLPGFAKERAEVVDQDRVNEESKNIAVNQLNEMLFIDCFMMIIF